MYDGHTAKRQRTDNQIHDDQKFGPGGQGGQYFNQNNRGGKGREEEKPNHILLMTILNPTYPITVDVIHTICTPSGKVLRIVIFKKNGVQAMVEFDSVDSAKRAKQSLNGADIYSGCCTLKIEYAKPNRLNVYKNDNESYDYTNPSLDDSYNSGEDYPTGKGSKRPALLQEPQGFRGEPAPYKNQRPPNDYYGMDDGYDNYGGRNGPQGGFRGGPYGGSQDYYGGPPERFRGPDSYERPVPPVGPGYSAGGPPAAGGPQQGGCVMMVYGLNHEKMNADRLFNLFCLYGNVMRVKFLKSKEGCAMIQMGDPLSVERSIGNLNGVNFFGRELQLGYSKQAFLNDVQQPFEMPDKTPSFKDYLGSRNNRFTNPEAATKNRIQPPSKILHFFNSPFGVNEDDMKKVFEEAGVKIPKNVKLFPSKTERSSSGLLEFENISEAVEALVLCNHAPIPNPNGKFPYTLKLCFSSSGPRF